MRPDIAIWFQFADEDLRMANLAMGAGLANQACFHAQQCCEKLLKAVLVARDLAPPRTHKMADLLSCLTQIGHAQLNDRLRLLDRFYISTRYPDAIPGSIEVGMPSDSDVKDAIQTAVDCVAWASEAVGCFPEKDD